MPTNHLKEITYQDGGKVLIYGPGRAVDIRNHRLPHHVLAASPSFPSKRAGRWTMALRRLAIEMPRPDVRPWPCSPRPEQIAWPVFSSIIDVKKNDLPLYISWKWKSELFDTLLKGV